MYASNKRPTPEMVQKGWERNPDGGGIAWQVGDEVHWRKGLKQHEMVALCKTTPMPYVAHFRRASSGGDSERLTHPFPIEKNVSLALKGRIKGNVLFHNGDWSDWRTICLTVAVSKGATFPGGEWSDSRGIAWMCSLLGPGFSKFLPLANKGIVFGPKTADFILGDTQSEQNGWKEINDVWCSNSLFWIPKLTHSVTVFGRVFCKHIGCSDSTIGNSDWCLKHDSAGNIEGRKVEAANAARPFASLQDAEDQYRLGNINRKQVRKERKRFRDLASSTHPTEKTRGWGWKSQTFID